MCVCLLCVCCLIMLLRFLFLLIGKILQLLLTVAHQLEFKDCPYNREKFPQHPEMTINLEESGRSLWDPIDPDKLKVVKQARKHCCWEIMQCKICFLTLHLLTWILALRHQEFPKLSLFDFHVLFVIFEFHFILNCLTTRDVVWIVHNFLKWKNFFHYLTWKKKGLLHVG